MDKIPSLNTNNGIGSLMDLLAKVDNSPNKKTMVNKKEEGPRLNGLELRDEWKREFNTMTDHQKIDKCSAWLTCGCPESATPSFVIEHIKTLDDTIKEKMREDFKVGQDKARYWNKNLSSSFFGLINIHEFQWLFFIILSSSFKITAFEFSRFIVIFSIITSNY